MEIFKSLAREAATPRQLLQNLYNFFDFPNDFDVEVFLHQLILEYQTLGLLNITESCDA